MPGAAELYRALWEHARGAHRTAIAAVLLLVGSQVVTLGVPWLAGRAINALQSGGVDALGDAGRWIGLIFVATVASWALHGPGRILERNVAIRVRERFADRLVGRLLDAPLEWHEARHSGETIHRVEQGTRALYDFAQSQFIYLQNGVSLFGPIIALALLSPGVGAVALLGYGLIVWGVIGLDGRMMRLAAQENAAEGRLQAAWVDALGNVVSVFALRMQAGTRARLRERLQAVFGPLRRMIVLNEIKWCSVDLLSNALWCVLLVLYVWTEHRDAQAAGTALMLGGVFMVHQYAQQAGGVVTAIASQYQSFARHRADYASAAPILQTPTAVGRAGPESSAAADAPQDRPASANADWRRIEIAGLAFSHPGTSGGRAFALHSLDLTLDRGARIALVGESGSGKSSLLRVLAGLYGTARGTVTVDAAAASLARIAELATLIPQDAEVFEGTLRENLQLAGEADDATLREALAVACLTDWLAALPEGLASTLAERGGNLSGGQRQRIAFARGWVAARASSLLLLDEISSALDPATEGLLFDALLRARPDATVIASVHRPQLLARFDTVLWMEGGRLIDRGTPAQLAARHPAFGRRLAQPTQPPG
jgi:ATP-binding cassette subfamily B protein